MMAKDGEPKIAPLFLVSVEEGTRMERGVAKFSSCRRKELVPKAARHLLHLSPSCTVTQRRRETWFRTPQDPKDGQGTKFRPAPDSKDGERLGVELLKTPKTMKSLKLEDADAEPLALFNQLTWEGPQACDLGRYSTQTRYVSPSSSFS